MDEESLCLKCIEAAKCRRYKKYVEDGYKKEDKIIMCSKFEDAYEAFLKELNKRCIHI